MRELIISKAGVCDVDCGYDKDIKVNSESMLDELNSELEKMHMVKKDYHGCFAAKITIKVEFLGDMVMED